MKSGDEELCKVIFDKFLQEVNEPTSIQWHDVEQKDEPPDYYLSLDNIKYAVEVTILMEKLPVGSMKRPQVEIVESLQRLVDEVAEIAQQLGVLNGTYIVGFLRPIENLRQVKQQIKDDLLDYVERTKDMKDAAEEKIFDPDGVQECSIKKVLNSSNKIATAGPVQIKWEGEAAIEICALVQERLANKANKLRNIAEPKILLLLDYYRFASSQMYMDCTSKLASLTSFHTIFVVQDEAKNFVLHSVNSKWS